MSRLLKTYCIGHALPLFTPSIQFDMLCPVALGIANELVIDDNRFGTPVDGSSLAEYSQLFGLYDKLLSGDIVADDLYLFQYRKFVSPIFGGMDSKLPWTRELPSDLAPSIFPSTEQLQIFASRLAVGSLFAYDRSVTANYAQCHVIEDLVMFAVACAESDVLNQADIKYFTTISGIIPSPSVCFIQVDLFIKIMKNLKTVWDYYYPSYHIPRTGYQHRVSGYLLERLHSFLLCKWLMDNSEPDINIWHRYTVTTNDFPVHLIR